jgi:hypothetical protein
VGIDNPAVVDAVSTEKDGSRVHLTIFDAEDWSDERSHLFALQAKLNSYFDFVQSGQLFEEYPAAQRTPVTIDVIFRVPPEKAKGLLTRADEVSRQLGLEVAYQVRASVG